jgi:hypothetical protein
MRVVVRRKPPGAGHLVGVGAGVGVSVRVGVGVIVGEGVRVSVSVGPNGVRVAVPGLVGADVMVGVRVLVAVAVGVGEGRTNPTTVEQATPDVQVASAMAVKKMQRIFIIWAGCGLG